MSACIWYLSKYVALPSDRVGARSFLLLREMAREGHRPIVFTSDSNHLVNRPPVKGGHEKLTLDGVEVCWVRTFKYKGAKSLGRIISWLHFEWCLWRLNKGAFARPDVIIASSLSIFTIFNGLWLRRRYGCRLIFEVRDIWPLTLIEEGGFSPGNPLVMLLGWVERRAYRVSDAIVGTMPNLAEHVESVLDEKVSRPPVYCIPMGIDQDQIGASEPLPNGYTDTYIPKNKFLICHAGTVGTTNALETLLSCARQMRDRSDIHFLIVGEGSCKALYQAQCVDLPNVSFAPGVPKASVQAVLQQCDLLYFAAHVSRVWRYGQSLNKVIDYMMAGKPIVASYSGYPSMIDEAGAGSYVPAGDVEALCKEIARFAAMPPAERAEMGAAAREWLLRNRNYKRLAQDYLALALPVQTA